MRRFALGLLVSLVGCSVREPGVSTPVTWIAETGGGSTAPVSASIADRYRDVAAKIVAAARADRGAYVKLAQLTDRIGHRISGSAQLDQAIAWAVQTMKDDGHITRTEPVMVPRWVRGAESAELVTPRARPLHVLGLGGSVSTPKGGITAPVVVVHDWAELEAKRAAVKGAIVFYDVAMPVWSETTSGYGGVVEYRGYGATRAAKHGAVGVLMRSVTAHSLQTPHTGAMRYDDGVAQIPAAAITVEDGALIARLASTGAVTVHLALESQNKDDVPSANVIGELRGRERPDEIVVIGAHLDSWDVGQGAHDDGAGCVTMMQTLTILKRLGLTPRRTIRVVLFTNEENGLRGGKQYAKDHAGELANTVFALESDSGGFAPRGFSVATPEVPTGAAIAARTVARITDIASLLKPINAHRVELGHGGADIGPMGVGGVPLVGLDTDNRTYFDIHHTAADTLDKVDPAALADDVAAVAVLAYIVADLADRVDAP